MFGRDKTSTKTTDPSPESSPVASSRDDTQAAEGPVRAGATPKKGRPTPTRKQQQAARRQPLVPVDRKAAKRQSRDDARRQRMEHREAFARGDDKALPRRDKGPVKAFIRDYVDSRRNFGEILLPLMLIVLVLTVLPNHLLQVAAFFLIWMVVLIGAVDAVLMVRRIKEQIRERFDTEPPRGTASYAVLRAFQLRASRRPAPRVTRGDQI